MPGSSARVPGRGSSARCPVDVQLANVLRAFDHKRARDFRGLTREFRRLGGVNLISNNTTAGSVMGRLLRLLIETADAISSGQKRSLAMARFLDAVERGELSLKREARAEHRSNWRSAHLAGCRYKKSCRHLLGLERRLLDLREGWTLRARGYGLIVLREALANLHAAPVPEAGAFAFGLGEYVARCAHDRPRSAEGKAVARFAWPAAEPWGTCAMCAERRPRFALAVCGHASSCRACLHRHCRWRLRAGCAPACPLCRAQLDVGEVTCLLAPHQTVYPHPSQLQRQRQRDGA